jgi:hypothetical protein
VNKLILPALLLVACGLLPGRTAAADTPAPSAAEKLTSAPYDGVWSGTVKCLSDPGIWPEDDCDFSLTLRIDGSRFRVHQVVRSKAGVETAADFPENFRFSRVSTNALAYSMEKGRDRDGRWVETWTFAMSLKDPKHLIVHATRIVNNIDLPLERLGSKYSVVAIGELTRQ